AQRLLDAFEYVQIDEDVVRSAIVEPDRLLRPLDAIHLATARILGPELTALLTYDDRLAKAAADAGMVPESVTIPAVPAQVRVARAFVARVLYPPRVPGRIQCSCWPASW
ncbi:MAG TPA: PIN domain-containing protein, partial [Streptosporangiaceae bacterium]